MHTSTAIKSEPVLKHTSHREGFFIRKCLKPTLTREGASDMPNPRASSIDISPEIHEINNDPMARPLRDDRGNWGFIHSLSISITDLATVNHPRYVFESNAVIPLKDTNVSFGDACVKLAPEKRGVNHMTNRSA